jgi:hypothetical protein
MSSLWRLFNALLKDRPPGAKELETHTRHHPSQEPPTMSPDEFVQLPPADEPVVVEGRDQP